MKTHRLRLKGYTARSEGHAHRVLSAAPGTVRTVPGPAEFDDSRGWFAAESSYSADRTGSAGFSQRVKALAITAPLHDLDARKSSVQVGDWTVYQMAELALNAIDLVTIAMDFDTGANPEQVLRDLTQAVAVQAPGRGAPEHGQVADWVLNNLLNVGSADRGFRTVYGHSSAAGYNLRTFDFKLLEETLGADGELYLRASNEAVNVLVGALELDLEAAHTAADVRLDILIRRGRLNEAQTAAQNARYRTIAYGEHLRLELDATSRNIRNVDWLRAMPAFLDQALEHVTSRYHDENAILTNLSEVLHTAETPVQKEQAAGLIRVVKDCLRRNDQLSAALQSAGRRFRAEQDRQSFSMAPALVSLDLHAQLLKPVLTLSVRGAAPALLDYFTAGTGLQVPPALRLADLYDTLITPPTERETLGEIVAEPELSAEEDPPRFSDRTYHHLEQILDLDPDAPQRLSGMLADARTIAADDPDADELPLLVVVRVLALAAQEIKAARLHHDATVLLAVDDGTPLDDPEYGGADLLVSRAEVIPDRVAGLAAGSGCAATASPPAGITDPSNTNPPASRPTADVAPGATDQPSKKDAA